MCGNTGEDFEDPARWFYRLGEDGRTDDWAGEMQRWIRGVSRAVACMQVRAIGMCPALTCLSGLLAAAGVPRIEQFLQDAFRQSFRRSAGLDLERRGLRALGLNAKGLQ